MKTGQWVIANDPLVNFAWPPPLWSHQIPANLFSLTYISPQTISMCTCCSGHLNFALFLICGFFFTSLYDTTHFNPSSLVFLSQLRQHLLLLILITLDMARKKATSQGPPHYAFTPTRRSARINVGPVEETLGQRFRNLVEACWVLWFCPRGQRHHQFWASAWWWCSCCITTTNEA